MDYPVVKAVWKVLGVFGRHALVAGNGVVPHFSCAIPEGPFVLLANHAHAHDAYVIGSIIGRPVRYMANVEGVSPVAAAFAGLVGAFGKRKGMPDVSALRAALAYLRAGEPVGIFPEGDRSWDGRTAPIAAGIAKLVRMAKVPVVLARQNGSFLTFPRWADARRHGRWNIAFSRLDPEMVSDAPVERLAEGIRDGLANDDPAWAADADVRFSCDAPARGARRVLWACPACGSTARMRDGDTNTACMECGASWRVDPNCGISRVAGTNGHFDGAPESQDFSGMAAWMEWQRSYAARLVASKRSPVVAARVAGLKNLYPGKRPATGPGMLRASATGFSFEPDSDDGLLEFFATRIEGLVDNFNRFCSFGYGKERWRLDQGSSPALMWIDMARAALDAAMAGA